MNTNSKIIISAIVGLLIGAGGAMAFTMNDEYENAGDTGHMMGDSMMQDSMDGMTTSLQGKSGDAFDHAFLSEMVVHHQGAVQMAQMALVNAKHQEIKDLAQNIISAQNKEITQMNTWSADWYGKTLPAQ